MYTELLAAALAAQQSSVTGPTTGPCPAELPLYRARTRRNERSRQGSGWAAGALSDQLAYDVALVLLAVQQGIDVDLDAFERPPLGRSGLEQALLALSIPRGDAERQCTRPGWS